MFKYKNISGKDLSLVNYGLVKNDEVIEVKEKIYNINFELVKSKEVKNGEQVDKNKNK